MIGAGDVQLLGVDSLQHLEDQRVSFVTEKWPVAEIELADEITALTVDVSQVGTEKLGKGRDGELRHRAS